MLIIHKCKPLSSPAIPTGSPPPCTSCIPAAPTSRSPHILQPPCCTAAVLLLYRNNVPAALASQSGDSAAAAFSVRQALSTLGMLLGSGAAALAFQVGSGCRQGTAGNRGKWPGTACPFPSPPGPARFGTSSCEAMQQLRGSGGHSLSADAGLPPLDRLRARPAHLPAGLPVQLTGRSYEATFALSVIPALLGLALVASAFSADAKAANAHRE